MNRLFVIRRRFSPLHSAFGRWLMERSGDRLHAEALYIFVVTIAAAGYMLATFLAWTVLADRIAADPAGRAAILLWTAQLVVPALAILYAGIGFRPRIRIRMDACGITAERGEEDDVYLSFDLLRSVTVMEAVDYHRHVRPRAATTPLIDRRCDRVVALRDDERILAIGLREPDLRELLRSLPAHPGTNEADASDYPGVGAESEATADSASAA